MTYILAKITKTGRKIYVSGLTDLGYDVSDLATAAMRFPTEDAALAMAADTDNEFHVERGMMSCAEDSPFVSAKRDIAKPCA